MSARFAGVFCHGNGAICASVEHMVGRIGGGDDELRMNKAAISAAGNNHER
jgi:hypothetical protein